MLKLAAIAALVLLPTAAQAQGDLLVQGQAGSAQLARWERDAARRANDVEAWLNMGMAYRALGREAEARAALEHVAALDNTVLQDRVGTDVWSRQLARDALRGAPRVVTASAE